MIDLHGDLAGIVAAAKGTEQKAASKGGQVRDRVDAGALDGVVAWAQTNLVAGAQNALAPLFQDIIVKTKGWSGRRR